MREAGWHLDKRVPITLILAIALQTGGVIWFMSGMEARLTQSESKISALELSQQTGRIASERNTTNIAVINQNLQEIHRTLSRIEKKMDQP
jgi:hypothetical protein